MLCRGHLRSGGLGLWPQPSALWRETGEEQDLLENTQCWDSGLWFELHSFWAAWPIVSVSSPHLSILTLQVREAPNMLLTCVQGHDASGFPDAEMAGTEGLREARAGRGRGVSSWENRRPVTQAIGHHPGRQLTP